MRLPDLSRFTVHKALDDVDLDGVAMPGLSVTFHRRPTRSRVATVGVYRFAGLEVFMAWGYVGEAHCRFTSYADGRGGWGAPRRGCPSVDAVRALVATLGPVSTPH